LWRQLNFWGVRSKGITRIPLGVKRIKDLLRDAKEDGGSDASNAGNKCESVAIYGDALEPTKKNYKKRTGRDQHRARSSKRPSSSAAARAREKTKRNHTGTKSRSAGFQKNRAQALSGTRLPLELRGPGGKCVLHRPEERMRIFESGRQGTSASESGLKPNGPSGRKRQKKKRIARPRRRRTERNSRQRR